jgi:hypothetical protein
VRWGALAPSGARSGMGKGDWWLAGPIYKPAMAVLAVRNISPLLGIFRARHCVHSLRRFTIARAYPRAQQRGFGLIHGGTAMASPPPRVEVRQ